LASWGQAPGQDKTKHNKYKNREQEKCPCRRPVCSTQKNAENVTGLDIVKKVA
jgi:hypothetical protein